MELDTFIKLKKESIYVIAFDSGVIKVGRGYSPEQRIKAHRKIGIIAGWKIIQTFSIECKFDAIKAEKHLIAKCIEKCSEVRAREWFLGLEFDNVIEEAKTLSNA